MMPTDTERRDVAHMLREVRYDNIDEIFLRIGLTWKDGWADFCRRIADFVDPPYPDATSSYKGWRAEVYDPDGVLVSPSNVAADLVRAHANPKMRHSTKEEQNEYSAMLEKMSVELHPVDRDALLALVDEMETADPEDLDVAIDYVTECASRIRKALGVTNG